MKVLLVYSSETGNTKMLADAIYDIDREIVDRFSVEKAPPPEDYDLVIIGYWVDKSEADSKTLDYVRSLKGKDVLFFFTLGAYPDTQYSESCVKKGFKMLEGNNILSHFHCQGKIDPNIIKRRLSLPIDNPKYPTKEQLERWQVAYNHPDKNDLLKVVEKFSPFITEYSLEEESMESYLVE